MNSPCAIVRSAPGSPVAWSKDTLHGPVIDGLREWEQDPAAARWLGGRPGARPSAARISECFAAWCSALAECADCKAVWSGEHEASVGETKIRAGRGCMQLEIEIGLPVGLPLERLENWRRQCNQCLRLVGIAADWGAVRVSVPYVEADARQAATLVQALHHVRDQLNAALSALGDPAVCKAFLEWRGDEK